jgi:hypothetical protein
MTRPQPRVVALRPDQVRSWRLGRQRLRQGTEAATPEAVARDVVGVQAQVMSAAALSVAVRSADLGVDALPAALRERRMVRSWAMRGTLHVFAADDYPTIVAALRGREMWRRPAWLRWFGMTEAGMEALIEAVGELLDDGRPRTRAELSDELGRRFGSNVGERVRSGWGSYLKPAADRGYLCQAFDGTSTVAFTRPARWLGSWRDEEPAGAIIAVVERFLAAYGPASMTELRLWWGTQPAMLRPAIASLGDAVTRVEVAGAPGVVLTSDLDAIAGAPPLDGSLRLLGPFDPLIVSGGQRALVVPPAHLPRVSRTGGWISPVLLIDGVVAGVWTSERSGNGLRITVEPFRRLSAAHRRALAREAESVAARHAAAAVLTLGTVFATAARDGEPVS